MAHTPLPQPDAVVERIVALYESRGRRSYDGAVDQLDHGLQAAVLAERAGASPALVLAALLHDIGHLLEDGVARGADGLHERLDARLLNAWFPQAVVAPVALHVDAKRYLVATDPSYAARLSEASVRSLSLQGGPFSRTEIQRFESSPHAEAALRLRRWDDAAKVAGAAVPSLRCFSGLMRGHFLLTTH